jgi:hypothetical protein
LDVRVISGALPPFPEFLRFHQNPARESDDSPAVFPNHKYKKANLHPPFSFTCDDNFSKASPWISWLMVRMAGWQVIEEWKDGERVT